MTLNISLPKALEDRVREQVASGRYGSASEVVREALRLFETYQQIQSSNLSQLQAEIAKGMKDIESGRVKKMDIDTIKRKARISKK
jgi:antitoxin ParD1/3/4